MSRVGIVAAAALLLISGPGGHVAVAQCILANPSFEIMGSGGETLGGWNDFGAVGSSSDATHGAVAARVSGADQGGWDVSAYWQRLDTAPGERWSASVRGWHSSANPLSGDSRAILNIEWRDAAGDLIDFESHTVADASTPPDDVVEYIVESQPAPSGAVATHFLLGVLQSPTDPAPDVFYDQATFDNLGPPTLDERQWLDFPGGRTIDFSGRTWRVKGPGLYGPGPNLFCDTANCTWVDGDGRLHVTIRNVGGSWYSTELALEEALGYGDYIFTTVGRIDDLHPNVVLGLFLWQYGPCFQPENGWWNPYNEIDIEFSRWGSQGNDVGQFVVQPFDYPGNISRFDAPFELDERTSHAFRWLSDRVEYRSWRGGPDDEAQAEPIHAWTYVGPHNPRPEQPRVHINLWQFDGPPDTDQEVVLDAFTFVPDQTAYAPPPALCGTSLSAAVPNPLQSRTTIRFSLATPGETEIHIYDVTGRLVRKLLRDVVGAGGHEVVWDGRDESGSPVASGVYLYRLRAGGVTDTKTIVLSK